MQQCVRQPSFLCSSKVALKRCLPFQIRCLRISSIRESSECTHHSVILSTGQQLLVVTQSDFVHIIGMTAQNTDDAARRPRCGPCYNDSQNVQIAGEVDSHPSLQALAKVVPAGKTAKLRTGSGEPLRRSNSSPRSFQRLISRSAETFSWLC